MPEDVLKDLRLHPRLNTPGSESVTQRMKRDSSFNPLVNDIVLLKDALKLHYALEDKILKDIPKRIASLEQRIFQVRITLFKFIWALN